MFKQCKINTWFFVGHSIGITLLALHTLEYAYFSIEKERRGKMFIVVTQNPFFYQSILAVYSNIEIIQLSLKNIPKLFFIYFRHILQEHLVFHPMAFSEPHLVFKLYTKLITIPKRKSRSVAFVADTILNKVCFSVRLPKNLKQSIFLSMEQAVSNVLPVKDSLPFSILFEINKSKSINKLTDYIMLHPYAASPVRSLPFVRWVDIVLYLQSLSPKTSIILSGGPNDRSQAELLMSKVGKNIFFIEDIAKGSFKKKIQIIAQAKYYIGVDTGITHLASMLGKKSLVIASNSNPCWLPSYNPLATIIMNTKNCTCTGDKQGDCFVYINNLRYYRCLIEIPQEVIKSEINKNLKL